MENLELIRIEIDGSAKTFVYKDPDEKLGLLEKLKRFVKSFRDRIQ